MGVFLFFFNPVAVIELIDCMRFIDKDCRVGIGGCMFREGFSYILQCLQVDIEILKGQKGKGKELGEAYEDQDSHSPLSGLAVLLNLFFYSTLLRKASENYPLSSSILTSSALITHRSCWHPTTAMSTWSKYSSATAQTPIH